MNGWQRLRSCVCISSTAWRLRRAGFNSVAAHLLKPQLDMDHTLPQRARDCQSFIMLSARLPWSTCLTRSIWLCQTLRADGINAVLRLGVDREHLTQHGGFHAHAWIAVGDQTLDENPSKNHNFSALTTSVGMHHDRRRQTESHERD